MNSDEITKIDNGSEQPKQTPVAVIGMASIFPGAANLTEYWENLLHKVDSIVEVPASRWSIEDYYDQNPETEDKTYCKRGAFIPDVVFDPAEFGLPPNLLEATDVSQLLSLIVARDCLDDGGYGENHPILREKTGVILGMVGINSKLAVQMMARLQYPIWEKVLLSQGISEADTRRIIEKIKLAYPKWEENSFPGFLGNVVAGRIANRFGLGGTNCTVDAACASSLAAVRMAVSELAAGRADLMITGGVDTDNSIGTYMSFSKTPAFSTGEVVRPFDQDSQGMMVGEGIGMVLLKRLEDAERDGDRIYAVIKGIGSSSDGRYKSIYAPSPAGQSSALRRAYQEAGYSPLTVGLLEAHGTGTKAGDPAEFQGLVEVFSGEGSPRQRIALGSVKSQIAHTKAAAGVAGLIKASLALYHKVLPATLHISTPDPKLKIEETAFYLNTELRPWVNAAGHPRRAGVSAFGFGGTNFHVALEEYQAEHEKPYRLNRTPEIILLSAATPEELLQTCQAAAARLESGQGAQEFAVLSAAARTAGIDSNFARLGFVAADAAEALAQLKLAVGLLAKIGAEESAEHSAGIYYRRAGLDPQGKLVALFPGQGSQYVNMGLKLAANYPPVRQAFARMDRHFLQEGETALSEIVYPIPVFDDKSLERQSEQLTRTEYAQPAIGALSFGLYRLLQEAGFQADHAAGHSFGELTAYWAAGVLEDDDYCFLARRRGKAMAPPADPGFDAGGMLAVKGDLAQLERDLADFPQITLANRNSTNQVVLAGRSADVAEVEKLLGEKLYTVVRLPVSAAFHTSLVSHAQKPFGDAVGKTPFSPPEIAAYSNTTGLQISQDPEGIRKALAEHILKPVLFKDEIEEIYANGGSIFVEFGPKNVLTNLVKNILAGKPHTAIALNPNPKKDSDRQLREAVAQLLVLGLDLHGFDPYDHSEQKIAERRPSSASVTLNGGLYLSDKTRSAFAAALSEQNPTMTITNRPPGQPLQPDPVLETLPAGLIDQLYSFQRDALNAHSSFLSISSEYVSRYTQLAQQSLDLLTGHSEQPVLEQINQALQTLERSMEQFHQLHGETIRIHEQYTRSQDAWFSQVMQMLPVSAISSANPTRQQRVELPGSIQELPVQPVERISSGSNGHKPAAEPSDAASYAANLPSNTAPLAVIAAAAPQSSPAQPALNVERLKYELLELVSEKTGYPLEMLELEMDMESDLGIDSIKRVEILGAIQSRLPELTEQDMSQLTEMRTLGQIVDRMGSFTGPAVPVDVLLGLEQDEPAGSAAAFAEQVAREFVQVVSEKTGYPVEMLELEMDLEADLGIDSIKRVEILGAMQSLFPELNSIDPSELANLHTLEQIIGSMLPPEQPAVLEAAAPAVPQTPPAALAAVARRVVSRLPLPEPDYRELQVPEGSHALLLDDGTDLTPVLAERLIGEGLRVVVAQLPGELVQPRALPGSLSTVQLVSVREDDLAAGLTALRSEFGPVSIFIHLDPPNQPAGFLSETRAGLIKTSFLIAKNLQKDLEEAARAGFAGFITVSRMDGQLGLGGVKEIEPTSGALNGLVKTLSLEWEHVFFRAIDLDPGLEPAACAGMILAELHDPNRLVREVGCRQGERWTLTAGVSELPDLERLSLSLTPQSVVLVSGGARGITAQCVVGLARRTPCKFILVGRSSITQETPDWAKDCPEDAELKRRIMEDWIRQGEKPSPQRIEQRFRSLRAKEEVEATLREIRQAGADAVYIQADIASPIEDLQGLLAEPLRRMGKISAVIHAAGMLTDRLIGNKTAQDFDTVWQPKVTGLANLLKLAPPAGLDFIVLFSSVAGYFGNLGQSDYAMANEVLNKAAFEIQRQNPALRVLSINWGPWEGGMVTPEIARRFADRAMHLIPPSSGSASLLNEIAAAGPGGSTPAQVILGDLPARTASGAPLENRQHQVRRRLSLPANPFLFDHQIGQKPVLPATCASAWIAHTCEQVYPGMHAHLIEDFKVLKGIVFDETLADPYFVDLVETEVVPGEEVKLTATVRSSEEGGRPRYHYRANLTLVSRLPKSTRHALAADLFSLQPNSLAGNDLYQDGTLFHGPIFQGVRQVFSISENHVAMECLLREVLPQDQGQFPVGSINPYLADVFVQSLLIWTQLFDKAPCLPSHLSRLEIYQPVRFDEPCYVDLKIISHTGFSVVADLWIVDQDGELRMKFVGLQGTISPSLKRLLGVSITEMAINDG